MSKFTLGQRVTFTHVLRRERVAERLNDGTLIRKVWAKHRADGYWDERVNPVPQDGIVVGLRTLSDGWNDYNGEDGPVAFNATKSVPAVMIVTGLRRRPVFAPFEAIEAVPA